jgi:uncharacterized protein (DUF305 family)
MRSGHGHPDPAVKMMEETKPLARGNVLQTALIVVLVALSLALGALWWLSQPPGEGDPAVRFARDMSYHHQQAVEMALLLRDRTEDANLRQILIDMTLTQQAQIGQMTGWLETWSLPISGPEAPMTGPMVQDGHTMDMTPEMMGIQPQTEVNKIGTLPVPEAEVLFLQLMIKHHRGAIVMAESVLEQTQRAPVVRLAQGVIAAQESEIALMQ